jgi:hypothetical protein
MSEKSRLRARVVTSDNQHIAFDVVWLLFLTVRESNPCSWDERLDLSHKVAAGRVGKKTKQVTDSDTDCSYAGDMVEDGEGPGYSARTFWTLDDSSGPGRYWKIKDVINSQRWRGSLKGVLSEPHPAGVPVCCKKHGGLVETGPCTPCRCGANAGNKGESGQSRVRLKEKKV